MSCLYYHCAADGKILYIGKSVNLHSRTTGHAHGSDWWDEVDFIYVEHIPKDVDLDSAEQFRIAEMSPVYNKIRYGRSRKVREGSETAHTQAKSISPGYNNRTYQTIQDIGLAIEMTAGLLAVDSVYINPNETNLRHIKLFELFTMELHRLRLLLRDQKRDFEHNLAGSYKDFESWLACYGRLSLCISRFIDDLEVVDKSPEWRKELRVRFRDTLTSIRHIFVETNGRYFRRHMQTPSEYGRHIWERAFQTIGHGDYGIDIPQAERQEICDAMNRSTGQM